LILLQLKKGPAHGYDVLQELCKQFGEVWQAKSGTVYPALRRLEEKGLVEGEKWNRKRGQTSGGIG
jgi:DNA-binding PadR family transcriptional regulator